MQMSEKIDKLAEALALAQAEIEDAERSRQNPAFRSQYSTLGDIWDACRPQLAKNGLSIVQGAEPSDPGTISLTTTLLHKSGQFISHTQTFRLTKDDPQGFGSASTYARRYGLAAMVGVCPDDDDGNAASGRSGPPHATRPEYSRESLERTRQADACGSSGPSHTQAVQEKVQERVQTASRAVDERVAAADPRKPMWDELKKLAAEQGVKAQAFIDAVFPNGGHGGVDARDLSPDETRKVLEHARKESNEKAQGAKGTKKETQQEPVPA